MGPVAAPPGAGAETALDPERFLCPENASGSESSSEFAPRWPRWSCDAHFEKATLALEELAGLALDRYRSEKGQDSLLDFEDLLALARSLVRLPEVRRILRSRHRFFLVDEFQDTNRLQWEILKPLLGPDSNFFAVGDDKQSIYRFRDADVSVFRAVRKWVRRRGRVVELRRNYRSHSSLVRFSNRSFGT